MKKIYKFLITFCLIFAGSSLLLFFISNTADAATVTHCWQVSSVNLPCKDFCSKMGKSCAGGKCSSSTGTFGCSITGYPCAGGSQGFGQPMCCCSWDIKTCPPGTTCQTEVPPDYCVYGGDCDVLVGKCTRVESGVNADLPCYEYCADRNKICMGGKCTSSKETFGCKRTGYPCAGGSQGFGQPMCCCGDYRSIGKCVGPCLFVDLKVSTDSIDWQYSLTGLSPLNGVDLKAEVSGAATGKITYKFDCTGDGTWEKIYTTLDKENIATDLCNYPMKGIYYPKVQVTRQQLVVENNALVAVSSPPSLTLIAPPDDVWINYNPTYEAQVSDPDGDKISGYFDFSPDGLIPDGLGSEVSSGFNSKYAPNTPDTNGIEWRALARDEIGVKSNWTDYWTVKKDTVDPIPSIDQTNGVILGTTIEVNLTESDERSGIAEGDVDVRINGGVWENTGLPNGGNTLDDFNYTGSDGNTYNFRYRVKDNAENWSDWIDDGSVTTCEYCVVESICSLRVAKACMAADAQSDIYNLSDNDDSSDTWCTYNEHDGCEYVKSGVELVRDDNPGFWEGDISCHSGGSSSLYGEKKVFVDDITKYTIKTEVSKVDDNSWIWINVPEGAEDDTNDVDDLHISGPGNTDWIDLTSYFNTGWNTIKFRAEDICSGVRGFNLDWDVTLINYPPDKPTGLDEEWNHCDYKGVSLPTFEWSEYFDPDDDPSGTDPQTAYEIRIDDDPSFDPLIIEPEEFTASGGASSEYTPVPSDWKNWPMEWNKNYWWIAKVKDSNNNWSAPSDAKKFKTPKHAYPWPDFLCNGIDCSTFESIEDEIVVLTDNSTYYNGKNYCTWGLPPGSNLEEGDIDYDCEIKAKFQIGEDQPIKFSPFDSAGYYCPCSKAINVFIPLPDWTEMPPTAWLRNFLANILEFFKIRI